MPNPNPKRQNLKTRRGAYAAGREHERAAIVARIRRRAALISGLDPVDARPLFELADYLEQVPSGCLVE